MPRQSVPSPYHLGFVLQRPDTVGEAFRYIGVPSPYHLGFVLQLRTQERSFYARLTQVPSPYHLGFVLQQGMFLDPSPRSPKVPSPYHLGFVLQL